jgi:phosphopentomutase
MNRAIILVLDSLGVGASADSYKYGDEGSDTLGHIAEYCESGKADSVFRQGMLNIPNLQRWGLVAAANNSRGVSMPLKQHINPKGAYGYAREVSIGKDTPSGHWEICGLPVSFQWGLFPDKENCFPRDLIQELIVKGKINGTIANKHASGTEVIKEFGEEHIKSGKPICYTSADSVFQIAAHETHFGLDRLYKLCEIAKKLVDPLNVARVIARPFVGENPNNFERTANRRDLTTPPIGLTLLNHIVNSKGDVVSIGKISDIFAHQGITHNVKGESNMVLIDKLIEQMKKTKEGLLFVNLVDFDSKFGHRRDVPGYAYALEQLDSRIQEIESHLEDNDLVLVTADHGCDPTSPGSNHTREHVPVVFFSKHIKQMDLGERESFADMGQTIAAHLEVESLSHGKSCNLQYY